MSPCLKENRGVEIGAPWVGRAWQPGTRWPRQGMVSSQLQKRPQAMLSKAGRAWELGSSGGPGGAESLGGRQHGEARLGSGLSGN